MTNSGENADLHFARSVKNPGEQGGRPAVDVHLSRSSEYQCYLKV